jgi:hypothetical protein
MDNSKFTGCYVIGTKTQEEAIKGKGLILWMQEKPSWFHRVCNLFVLGIRWVDKQDYEFEKLFAKKEQLEKIVETTKVQFPKHRTYKKKKVDETK